jgi:hypothetical protein
MATFVQLTHYVNKKPAPVYVNVDQICRIGDSVGAGPGYQANILLAQGQVDVLESVAEVMQLIKPSGAAVTAAASLAARAPRSSTKSK